MTKYIITFLLSLTISSHASDLRTITKNDRLYYVDRVNSIINDNLKTGRLPTASDVLDLRTAEMNFIMSVRAAILVWQDTFHHYTLQASLSSGIQDIYPDNWFWPNAALLASTYLMTALMVESLKGKDLLHIHAHSRKSNTLTTQSAMKILSNIAPVIGAVVLLTSSGCNHTLMLLTIRERLTLPMLEDWGYPKMFKILNQRIFQTPGLLLLRAHPNRLPQFGFKAWNLKPPASSNYPRSPQDFVQAASYAEHCVQEQRYAEAAKNFELAANVPGGTDPPSLEREMFTSAAVVWLCAGESALEARSSLSKAQSLHAHAPSSQRIMFMDALLNKKVDPAMSPSLRSVLPNQ